MSIRKGYTLINNRHIIKYRLLMVQQYVNLVLYLINLLAVNICAYINKFRHHFIYGLIHAVSLLKLDIYLTFYIFLGNVK